MNDQKTLDASSASILNAGLGAEPDYKLIAAKYQELLYAVAQKFPGETRHETALRYIRRAESASSSGPPMQVPNV